MSYEIENIKAMLEGIYIEREEIKDWLHSNDPYYAFYEADERTKTMVNWKYDDLEKLNNRQEELEQEFKKLDRLEYFKFMIEYEQKTKTWM